MTVIDSSCDSCACINKSASIKLGNLYTVKKPSMRQELNMWGMWMTGFSDLSTWMTEFSVTRMLCSCVTLGFCTSVGEHFLNSDFSKSAVYFFMLKG
jgi:hypothetical protein